MKSNTSVLLSIAVAILGYIVISQFSPPIDGALLFVIGALLSGLIIKLMSSTQTNDTEYENAEVNFDTITLYVGNLPYRANELAIRTLFSEHGKVLSVRLMKDKHTGKRRGFGFVEMPEKDALSAIDALNEQEFQERSLKVREANERTPRSDV